MLSDNKGLKLFLICLAVMFWPVALLSTAPARLIWAIKQKKKGQIVLFAVLTAIEILAIINGLAYKYHW